ncbi:hypothetical protein [Flavobacterium faecale]|uniref:ORC-CDC6 family AAA ATPase n=1 Tax=Flavobacterium faecale TaxID=1355330 RepID=UPI003AAA3468
MNNPFNITKANDYSDNEIQNYWVDFFGDREKIKPTSPMPILIKGSKGCGKTHLLKYFSYELQKIRGNGDKSKILEDKYIGIFMRCSGLDSFRFQGKGLLDEQWNLIFSNYLELWFAQKIITILSDFEIDVKIQSEVVKDILSLFDKYDNLEANNFNDLFSVIVGLQKKLDYETKNIGFKRTEKPDFDLLLNPGALIYGIPRIISKKILEFKDIFFLYIIDEFENITPNQQKIFNSLYRERDFPGSFRIGGRLHAFTNFNTLGSNEENRKGSEYDLIILDEDRREDEKKYSDFVLDICIKKLENNNYKDIDKNDFINSFEKFDETAFLNKISSRKERIKDIHTKDLISKLKQIGKNDEEIKLILSNISFEENKLIEKSKYLLFFREWKKGGDLISISNQIKIIAEEYKNNINFEDNKINKILKYYKTDLLDQLARESSMDIQTYVNLDNFIKMSSGTPRNFINIIKESYDNEFFREHKIPFSDGNKISIESQLKAIKKVNDWFFEVNRIPYVSKENIYPVDFLINLGNYLRELRFSNIPPECSINLFTLSKNFISKNSELISNLLNHSYLILSDERREKNINDKNSAFFINGTVVPKFELSINKRGVINLNDEIADAILKKADSILKKKMNDYNAPFKENNINLFDLFENE